MIQKEPEFFSTQVHSAKRFYQNMEQQDNDQDLVILTGGRESCQPGYFVNRENFPYFSLEFVASGRGKLTLRGKEHNLAPGTIFTYGPGIAHEIRNEGSSPLVKYFVNFSGRRAEALLKEKDILPTVMHSAIPDSLLGTFEELTEYGLNHTEYSQQICCHLLEILSCKFAESAISHEETGSTSYATYRKCRQIINTRYLSLMSQEEIAREANVDTSYLCRLFKRYDHQSPYKHLMRLKMNYAADLLLKAGSQVREVAREMGFEDPYHFSRTFKNYMGLSPRNFVQDWG